MSRRRVQSEQGQWSGAGDAGGSTRRQGLRSRPQQQAQGGEAAAQSSKARVSKRPRPAPPAVADCSLGNGRKRLKVPEGAASGSAGVEQVVERRSERLKHCLRVGYRNLDRFGTKEPFWEEIADDNAAPRGGGVVCKQQVQEKQEPVLKSWGKRKRRWSRVKEEVDAGEHEPEPEVWLHVDVSEVQGSREINAWIQKNRKEKLNGGLGTGASADEVESSSEEDVGKSADQSRRRARLLLARRKRPRIEKRLADLGIGSRGAIEKCASEVAVEDSASDQDVADEDRGLETTTSPSVTTRTDPVGLVEGGGNDDDEEKVVRSSADESSENEVLEPQTSKFLAGDVHGGLAEPVSSSSGDMAEVFDSGLKPTEADEALRCPIRLGSPARVSADAVSDLDKAQALSFVDAGKQETDSLRGTYYSPRNGAQELSAVHRAQTDDCSGSQEIMDGGEEGGGLLSASEDDLQKDDVSNNGVMVVEFPSGNCNDDVLREAGPHGDSGTVRNDEAGLSKGTMSTPESRSEKITFTASGVPGQTLQVLKISSPVGEDIHRGCADVGRERVLDDTHDVEEHLSSGRKDGYAVVEDLLLTDTDVSVPPEGSQEKIELVISEAEAESFHIQNMASLPTIDSFSQEMCSETDQRCLGGWIEEDMIDIVAQDVRSVECTEKLTGEGNPSLVQGAQGSSSNEPETGQVLDGGETIRAQTGWTLAGGSPASHVELARAPENENCEPPSGECLLLSLQGQAQFGGSQGADTCSPRIPKPELDVMGTAVQTSPFLGDQMGISTDIEFPARVEESQPVDGVRIEAELEEQEISELQKSLLESFHSFQDPGDTVFVSQGTQLDDSEQLTNEAQRGAGSIGDTTILIKHTDYLARTAVDSSIELPVIQSNTRLGQDLQDAGVCGHRKHISNSSTDTREGTTYADEPAVENSAVETNACTEPVTGFDKGFAVGSTEAMIEGTVGFVPLIKRDGDGLGQVSREPQEGKEEGYDVKCICMQEVVGGEREGSRVVPLGQGDLCPGHTVDEGSLLNLQLATDRSSVATPTKHSAGTQEEMPTTVSDMESQPLQSGSVSKFLMPMESVYSSTLIALSKKLNQMPIVYNDVEGSALEKQYQVLGLGPDDSVKVYCRRKRGRDLHLFDVAEMDQNPGGDGDADGQSDPMYSEAVIIFNKNASPQEKCSSHGAIDERPSLDETRSPVNSQAAVASELLDQGGVPQQGPFLACPVSYKGQALSDNLGDCREASDMSTEISPGSSGKSASRDDCISLKMRKFTSKLAHEELDNSCTYPKGLSAVRDVCTSQDACEEILLSKEEGNHCAGEGKTGVGEDVACMLRSREETGQGFTSTHATTDHGVPTVVAESGSCLLHHERSVVLPARTSRVTGAGETGLNLSSDALPLEMSSGESEWRSVIGYVQSDGMNEVSGQGHKVIVQEALQACSVEEIAEISSSPGQSVQSKVPGDELIVGSAVRMDVRQPEQIMIPDSVKKGTVNGLEASCLKDLANLQPMASKQGQESDTMLMQKAEDMRKRLVPESCEAGAIHLSDGTRKDRGDVCQKTGVEKDSEQPADTDLHLASDLHAAYLRSLKCGLCGGSSDGRPSKDMHTEDGKFLRGKSVLDKGEGFEDSEGWLGQLVGPLTSRTGVQGVWVHRQCAIWSPEVYFSGVGRMKNVKAALRRGRYLKCTSCSLPGATIGCCMERCPRTFHLPCARLEGCVFDHVKYLMTCIDHMHLLHPRGQKKPGSANAQTGLCEFEDGTDFHVGGFTKMVRERRIAAACARLKDLEAEDKWVENTAEDEEFLRRERKRLQRDLARMVPVQVGGQAVNDDGTLLSEGWESVAGLEDVIQSLKEVVTLPLLYPDVYNRLGVCPPRGVLLHGYPGTGKTHVVRAMVGACARGGQKVAYFARKGADCLGKYVGDSEKQLRLLFQIAEECQPSIIFFDEMDGLAPSRSGQNDQTHSSVVSTLLALMDGLNSRGSVVVIGATNRADALDPALRRPGRFDREILFPLPLVREREAILALHTRKWVPCPSLRLLSAVARVTSGFAGADLQALCVEAAMTALRRACPISKLVECAEKAHSLSDIPPLPLVQVRGADWAAALRHVSPPCSKRKTLTACGSARAAPLPKHMGRMLLPYLLEVLVTLHLDSRVSLPPGLRKLVMLVRQSIMSYAGYDTNGTTFPSNWLVLLRELPFQANGGQALAEALVETGITCGGDKFEASTLQVSAHSSESDCDSSGKDAIESQAEMDQIGRHELDSTLLPDTPLHQQTLVHKSSLQGRSNVMIAGAPKSGQSLIAAALLHGFESFGQVRVLSLPTMLQEGNGSVTEGLLSILGEAQRTSPCIIFMPNFEHWALERVPNEDLEEGGGPSPLQEAAIDGSTAERRTEAEELIKQSSMKSSMVASGSWKVLMQFMKSCNNAPILLLGTSEMYLKQHPSCVLRFFSGDKGSHSNVCSPQTVPSAIVEVPLITGSVSEIFESASEDIAKALAVDFVRKLCRLVVQLNRAESIPTCGGSDSTVVKLVAEQVAAGSSTEPVVNDFAACEDQGLQIEVEDDQEAKDRSVDVMPGSAQQAGSADFVMEVQEAQLAAQDSGSKLPPKHRQGHPCEGMSTNQRSLISAIVYCGFQLLHDPQFRELRQATARLKVGPQVNIKDSSGLDSSNVNEYCQQFSRQDVHAGSPDGSNSSEGAKEIWVRGVAAVGLIAYRGLYSTATEVAWELKRVIELLHQRIRKSVESGANQWDYFPITCQAAALEDMMGSWRHEVVRFEEATVQPSLGTVNLAPTTERPSLSACGSGAVPKHEEEHGAPAVGLVPGRSNSATEKVPSVVGLDESQDLGLSTHVRLQMNAENSILLTTAGEGKEAIEAGQEAQHCSSNNRPGCRDKVFDSLHGALSQQDTLVDLTSGSTDVQGIAPAAYPLQKSTIVAKFTKACLEKLQLTVKDVLVDAWQQNGSTTSADLLNDLITGSAASAMTASRGSMKGYEREPALLQDFSGLDCGSVVCWEQVNCLCTKRPMSCDLKTEGARSSQPVNSLLAEGTGETGSKAWKDRDGEVSRTKGGVVMQEPATGLCKGSADTVQDGEGCICLCPVVMALRKQKSKIRIQ